MKESWILNSFIHLPLGIFLCGTDEEEEELDFTIQTHVHQDDDDDDDEKKLSKI